MKSAQQDRKINPDTAYERAAAHRRAAAPKKTARSRRQASRLNWRAPRPALVLSLFFGVLALKHKLLLLLHLLHHFLHHVHSVLHRLHLRKTARPHRRGMTATHHRGMTATHHSMHGLHLFTHHRHVFVHHILLRSALGLLSLISLPVHLFEASLHLLMVWHLLGVCGRRRYCQQGGERNKSVSVDHRFILMKVLSDCNPEVGTPLIPYSVTSCHRPGCPLHSRCEKLGYSVSAMIGNAGGFLPAELRV